MSETIKIHDGNLEPMPCPEHLTGQARRLWEQLSRQLTEAGILTNASAPSFEIACQAYSDWREYTAQVKAQGAIVKSPNGFPVTHPAVALANKAGETWRKYAKQFGFGTKAAKTAPKPQGISKFLKKGG